MRWIRLFGWGICWLLGLLMLLLGLALSPWGTSWLLGQARSHGYIDYADVSGAPLDHLVLRDVSLNVAGTAITARRLDLQWASDCLLHGRICIDHLRGDGLHVKLAPSRTETSETSWGRYSTPIALELRQLALDDFSLELADGTRVGWQQLHGAIAFEGSQLTLGDTLLAAPHVYLPVSAQPVSEPPGARTSGAQRVNKRPEKAGSGATPSEGAQVSAAVPSENPLAALANSQGRTDSRLVLSDIQLPIDLLAPSLRVRDLKVSGSQQIQLKRIDAGFFAQGARVAIDHLDVAGPSLNAHLAGVAELKGDFPITLGAHVESGMAPLKGEQLDLAIDGSLAALRLDLAANGPQPLRLTASAQALDKHLPFELSLKSPRIRWPLPDMPARDAQGVPLASYQVNDLLLDANGTLEHFTTALKGHVSGSQLPPMQVALNGQGDKRHFEWSLLQVDAGRAGRIQSQGQASWVPYLSTNARVQLTHLKPQYFAPAITGDISGDARLGFHQTSQQASRPSASPGWQAGVKGLDLHGSLMNQPLSAQAEVSANSQWHATIKALRLVQGANHLEAHGQVSDQLHLAAVIDAPRLDTLLPQLAGRLQGNINVAGSLKSPSGDAQLTAAGVRYAANRIDALHLEAHSHGLEDPALAVKLAINGIKAGALQLSQAQLDLQGRLSQHHLSVAMQGNDAGLLRQAHLALKGGYNRKANRYTGTLQSLAADLPQAGHLALDRPLELKAELASSRVGLSPFCLVRSEGGSLCLSQPLKASPQQGSAALSLNQLPLAVANGYLPPAWQVDGNAEGNVMVHWADAGKRFNASGQVSSHARIKGQNSSGQSVTLPAIDISSHLQADQQRARLSLATRFEQAGSIQLDTSVVDPLGTRRLSGTLDVNDVRFAPYQRLVPMLDKLSGRLDGHVTVSGSAIQPRLDGQLAATGITAAGAQLPVELNDSQARLELSGDHGTLSGALVAGKTRWPLSGTADWPSTGDWQASARIDGSDSPLRAQALQYGQISIAPDISVKAAPQTLAIRGNIEIPWARIKVAQLLAFAQAPSTDEVILTREQAAQLDRLRQQMNQPVPPTSPAQARAWAEAGGLTKAGVALDLQVGIQLGRDVHLSAYGLDTNLTGHLDATQNNHGGGALQLYGDIQLNDGQFVSFGQRLLIQTGKITFNGPPSLPRLNIDAIRNPDTIEDNVTAGIKVTGTADAPRLSIYSDPAMNETTALSYLLRGHAPDSDGNDNALTQALIGLSISQSGRAVGAIGQAFGVQDLQLDAKGMGDNSQVVVSGYLNPNLKVSYGVGVFSSIAELTLRYRLLQDLYVQAVSGANQALDLLYSFHLGRTHPQEQP